MKNFSIITGLLLSFITATLLNAEIAPEYYAEDQRNAGEFIRVRVTDSDLDWCFFCSERDVKLEARVLEVLRSESGLKKSDKIIITYTTRLSHPGGWAGPRPIPVPEEGYETEAYLNKQKGTENIYLPAARGYSFSTVLIDPDRPGR